MLKFSSLASNPCLATRGPPLRVSLGIVSCCGQLSGEIGYSWWKTEAMCFARLVSMRCLHPLSRCHVDVCEGRGSEACFLRKGSALEPDWSVMSLDLCPTERMKTTEEASPWDCWCFQNNSPSYNPTHAGLSCWVVFCAVNGCLEASRRGLRTQHTSIFVRGLQTWLAFVPFLAPVLFGGMCSALAPVQFARVPSPVSGIWSSCLSLVLRRADTSQCLAPSAGCHHRWAGNLPEEAVSLFLKLGLFWLDSGICPLYCWHYGIFSFRCSLNRSWPSPAKLQNSHAHHLNKSSRDVRSFWPSPSPYQESKRISLGLKGSQSTFLLVHSSLNLQNWTL